MFDDGPLLYVLAVLAMALCLWVLTTDDEPRVSEHYRIYNPEGAR